MRIPMIRAAAVATAAIASVAVGAPSAQAAAPVMTDVNVDLTIPVGDLCSFPVDVHVVQTGTETDFFAADGALTQIIFRTVEQDTFSANGNTLSGLPYVNELRVVFDNTGQVVHAYATGIIERVPLPDGTTFLSAGRVDFVGHGAQLLITPDVGHSGNLAGFCSSLSA